MKDWKQRMKYWKQRRVFIERWESDGKVQGHREYYRMNERLSQRMKDWRQRMKDWKQKMFT